MKKYRLLKDIPGYIGTIENGAILEYNAKKKHYEIEGGIIYVPEKIVKNNPEFFEEVTRWKPMLGEDYIFIDSGGKERATMWVGDENDIERYEFRNCFETREQAEHARDEIKKLLLKLHEDE